MRPALAPDLTIIDAIEGGQLFDLSTGAELIRLVNRTPIFPVADMPAVFSDEVDPYAAFLAWQMNELAMATRFTIRDQTAPPPSHLARAAQQIADAASTILNVTEFDGESVVEGLGGGALFAQAKISGEPEGGKAVIRALNDVALLKNWAVKMSELEKRRAALLQEKKPASRGRKKDVAWHEFIKRLGGLYYLSWGLRPGVSRHPETHEPYGPFFRFAKKAMHVVYGKRCTDEALAKIIETHRWGT